MWCVVQSAGLLLVVIVMMLWVVFLGVLDGDGSDWIMIVSGGGIDGAHDVVMVGVVFMLSCCRW